MKWMHLADLHIGKAVNGYSMLEDQDHILNQMLDYVRKERPQAVLISGDVYDKPSPGADAVKVFDRFLTGLSKEAVWVLLIGGNHDSPERLAFASAIMEEQKVVLQGGFDGQLRRVALEDDFGAVQFYLLPFIKPSTVRRFFEDEEIASYDDALAAVLHGAGIDWAGRNVLLAHQFMVAKGVAPERSDSEVGPIGGVDSMDAGLISGFDYVALGHLHGPQRIGADHVRYGGSPLKYSFSECHHKKSLPLVELREKGDLSIRLLPLTPRRDMRMIKGPLATLRSKEVVSGGNPKDYLQVTLTDEEEVVDAIGALRSVYPNVMTLAFENTRTRAALDLSEPTPDAKVSPGELFHRFFLLQNGREMKPEQAALADRLLMRGGEEG